jgi:hypothetical protein
VDQPASAGVEQSVDVVGKQVGSIEDVEIAICGHAESYGTTLEAPSSFDCRCDLCISGVPRRFRSSLLAQFGCWRGSAVGAVRLFAPFGLTSPRSRLRND